MSFEGSSPLDNSLNQALLQQLQQVESELNTTKAALEASRQQVLALTERLAHEIAERQRAEEALKESEERHNLMAARVQNDLVLARQIQQSLLPPSTPKWPDLEVVCYTQPALEVGGDFYAYHA